MKIATRIIVLLVIVSSISTFSDGFEGQRVEGDPDLESYLREALENFREQMKTGIEAIKMPVLDPLVLKHLVVKVKEDAAVLDLIIHEVAIENLSKFSLHDLQPNLESLFLKVNLTLPVVRANGQYKADGKIVNIFPIYGEGDFQINVTGATISGFGKMGFVSDALQMTTLSLDMAWKEIDVNLENFLGGGKFAQVLQKILPSISRGAFETFKPQIMKEINKALKNELNKQLRKPEVKKIIEGIIPRN